jgi:hypothetical protein
MASLIDLNIAGRVYPVACREGEGESLKDAARLVDAKCREALAGLNFGRVLFIAFPFVIPLAVLGLRHWGLDLSRASPEAAKPDVSSA